MAETKESQENLAYIRTHVDNLERMVRFQISANPQSHAMIRQRFEQREGMAEVYLALDGDPKTQDEITERVHRSQPTVSRVCAELLKAGLVRTCPSVQDRRKTAYTWSDLEELVGVSRIAREYLVTVAKRNASDSEPTQGRRKRRLNGATTSPPEPPSDGE